MATMNWMELADRYGIACLVVVLLVLAGAAFAEPPSSPPGREWSMADLAHEIRIQKRHEEGIMGRPGVVGMGITLKDGLPAFLIMVGQGHNPELPREIEGVPVVVERGVDPQLIDGGTGCTANTGTLITTGCHSGLYDKPVPMGASTSTILACDAGTLGFKACDLTTGKPGYVTAGHVATRKANGCEGAPIGTTQVHRGIFESYNSGCNSYDFTIGTLAKWVPVVAGSAGSPNLVDAAWVISKDTDTTNQAIDIPAPFQPATPALNTCVKKSGRTSGLTYGKIDLVNTTLNPIGWCLGGTTQDKRAFFAGLFRFSYDGGSCGTCTDGGCNLVARGGDSGSAVVHILLKGWTYGLLVFNSNGGAYGYGIPTSTILSELGLGMGAQCP